VTRRPLYAQRGIPEYRIGNVQAGEVEVCRTPVGDGYETVSRLGRGDIVEPALLPRATISVDALLG
jgi:Uma2 family endonuclease